MINKTDILQEIFKKFAENNKQGAKDIINEKYPHVPRKPFSRSYSVEFCLEIFIRDGFIDRYSGSKLLFPGALRIISLELPDVFPYHPHWKMDETHIAYWQLFPTVDHIIPIVLGGSNNPDNLATTSQMMNSAKANWTLNELGWTLHDPGDIREWDGLMNQSIEYLDKHEELLEHPSLKKWYNAKKRVRETFFS